MLKWQTHPEANLLSDAGRWLGGFCFGRKNTYAVTKSPSALARPVRRTVASCAKRRTSLFQSSASTFTDASQGAVTTRAAKASARGTVTRKNTRGKNRG